MIQIKNRFDNAVIFEGDFDTILAAVLAAINKKTDLRSANLNSANLRSADLRSANLCSANLRSADLDFSDLHFSCKTLSAKFDQKHIIQILYHAAMPAQKNKLKLDDDLQALLNSEPFKKVVNKFHRIKECEEFKGIKS